MCCFIDEMKFYLRAYLDILDAQKEEKPGWEHVFYHAQWGIADSLGFPLMLAPLKSTDSADVTRQKINEVARYIETFAVRRSINFRNFGASSIRYTMYTLVKELRGKDLNSRREFIALVGGAAAAWPTGARAQQPERMRHIDVLSPLPADDPRAKTLIAAFLEGLAQLGWTDGRNVRIHYCWGAGDQRDAFAVAQRSWSRLRRTLSWPLPLRP